MLVELDAANQIADWLFPAPHDALLLQEVADPEQEGRLVPLTVLETPAGASTDMEALALVGAVQAVKEKPHRNAPNYWRWNSYEAWLKSPRTQDVKLGELGHDGLQRESRMHVSINGDNQTALEGALFQTSGLEFVRILRHTVDTVQLSHLTSLALAIETDAALQAGIDSVGGERRTAAWRKSSAALPTCSTALHEAVVQSKHCRLILVTPAYFAAGFMPDWVLRSQPGVRASVVGAAQQRHQVVSGWDFASNHPKPTRRLAPAGSVYYLKLDGNDDAIRSFVDALWLRAVSDDQQARLDGYGLAVVGTWDGVPKMMEVSS
jgi:CRISPR-associated protein Cmr3